jgi:hypothetical protein
MQFPGETGHSLRLDHEDDPAIEALRDESLDVRAGHLVG